MNALPMFFYWGPGDCCLLINQELSEWVNSGSLSKVNAVFIKWSQPAIALLYTSELPNKSIRFISAKVTKVVAEPKLHLNEDVQIISPCFHSHKKSQVICIEVKRWMTNEQWHICEVTAHPGSIFWVKPYLTVPFPEDDVVTNIHWKIK